jgi:hypothetical protein
MSYLNVRLDGISYNLIDLITQGNTWRGISGEIILQQHILIL